MFLNDIADALTAKQIREAAKKQRLDKSCWTGYHKAGTKVKGDTRVNNCVPNESVAEGMDDTVTFGVDSEKAYNHVMAKFGKAISWHGDDMTAPRKYWAAIQQLAHDAGGAAEETGYEQDVAETTGDKPFDRMMKTIKKGTKKQATADRREQKRQDQERTRAAIDNMFGSSMNQFKNLKIKEQGAAEGSQSRLQPGTQVMLWLGPKDMLPNPPRDDKRYWDRGVVVSEPEMMSGSWQVLVKSQRKGQSPISPARVFVLKQPDVTEAGDPNFVGFMNKSLGNKVDRPKENPLANTPDFYKNAPVANLDTNSSQGRALKWGIGILQKISPAQKAKLASLDEYGVESWLEDLAVKQGMAMDYNNPGDNDDRDRFQFAQEDIGECQELLGDVFHDPDINTWLDLIKSEQGVAEENKSPIKQKLTLAAMREIEKQAQERGEYKPFPQVKQTQHDLPKHPDFVRTVPADEGKIANALGAFTLGAAGVAGMLGNQDIDYKGYSFHHAPRAMSVPGSAKLMKVDGKELFMWRAINPEEGGPKYFYKTKDETRIDNAMGMNENFEPGETKRVLKSGGKPAGEIGLDPEASPGNGAYYIKHYASGYDLGGYDTYQEALEELRYIDKQYQYANKPADTRSKHEKMMDNSTYAEGYRDGVRGERNPRASNIFGPTSDVYDKGYEAGRVAKKGVGEDSWHGAGDEWHGTGDQWSGGGADGGAAPLMEYPMAQSVPADSDSPIHEAPGRIRMLKRLAKATGIDLSDLEHMTDAELRELYKEKVIAKLREFVPSDVQGPGVDDAQSPIAGKKRLSLNHDVEAPKPMGVAERKEQRLMALRLAEMRRAGYFD